MNGMVKRLIFKFYAFNQSEFKWFNTAEDLAEFLGITVGWLDKVLLHEVPKTQGYFVGFERVA